MAPSDITITGTSSIYHQAERAIMFISVSNSGTSQGEVSASVTNTANHVQSILMDLAPTLDTGVAIPDAAITHWTMKTPSSSSYVNDKINERIYSANTGFEI
jgi:hypothetical protein